jgi:hypothetical protein
VDPEVQGLQAGRAGGSGDDRKSRIRARVIAVSALGFAAGGALAQESDQPGRREHGLERVRRGKTQGMLERSRSPKETVNTRDGQVVAVRRGEILLFVSYRPRGVTRARWRSPAGYPFAAKDRP